MFITLHPDRGKCPGKRITFCTRLLQTKIANKTRVSANGAEVRIFATALLDAISSTLAPTDHWSRESPPFEVAHLTISAILRAFVSRPRCNSPQIKPHRRESGSVAAGQQNLRLAPQERASHLARPGKRTRQLDFPTHMRGCVEFNRWSRRAAASIHRASCPHPSRSP